MAFFEDFTAPDECTDPPTESDDALARFQVGTTGVSFTPEDAKNKR